MVSLHDAEDAARQIQPPGENGTSEQWRRWARNMAFAVGGGIIVTGLHIAWACGFLTVLGPQFSGFALASDVTNQELAVASKVDRLAKMQSQNRNEILATVISGTIITLSGERCQAIRNKNIALASSLDGQISDQQTKYETVSGGEIYPLQPCP